MQKKKLQLGSDKAVAGVCSGVAEYTGWDVKWVRIGWALIAIFPLEVVGGVVVYGIAWAFMRGAPTTALDSKPKKKAQPSRANRSVQAMA